MSKRKIDAIDDLLSKVRCIDLRDDDEKIFDVHYCQRDYHQNETFQLWMKYRYRDYFEQGRYTYYDVKYLIENNIIDEDERHQCILTLCLINHTDNELFRLFLSYGVEPDLYIESCLEWDKSEYLDMLYMYGAERNRSHFERALCYGKIKCIEYFISIGYVPTKHDLCMISPFIRDTILQKYHIRDEISYVS